MKIAVDINGVLIDNMENVVDFYNKRHNTNYNKNDVKNWEFYNDWNSSEEEFFEIFYFTYQDMTSVRFIDNDAPDYMKKLNEKHEVFILSALNSEFEAHIIEKLNHHGIKKKVQYIDVIVIPERPWDLKIKHKFDIYVDDNPNLVEPIKILKNRYLLLYNQPWNQDIECVNNIIRVFNWKDVFNTINKLKKIIPNLH